MRTDKAPSQISIPDSLLYPDSFDVTDNIDEDELSPAQDKEYTSFALNLGAETPRSVQNEASPTDVNYFLKRFNSHSHSTEDVAPVRSRLWRSASFYEKHRQRNKLRQDTSDRDCGICFEVAVSAARTLCCGKLYCYEHLYDWLHGPSSDGKCPSCGSRISVENGILSLKSPSLKPSIATPRLASSNRHVVPAISTSGIHTPRRTTTTTTDDDDESSPSVISASDDSSEESSTSSPSRSSSYTPSLHHSHSGLSLRRSRISSDSFTAETASKALSLLGLLLVFYVVLS